ncbi:hypothetical protein CDN99_25885 [Roseateles aquatilis]|uniref:Prepilin-type cleavage/methylation domain-containing protein n=1 Tax=Roseateles aquatilis TaxID=431061 RepID=A0A246ITN4_9BURK|nr:PilW family protein [Roseateles aquatilis]OWQ83566.1 hypothetical protein CDN99_25885 [Roseateles aquatilis]
MPIPHLPRVARRSGGFTLVELLISMTIGLVLIAALGIIMNRYETSKRRTATTSDLALNISYVAYDMDRQLRSAGSGFLQNTGALGCLINAAVNGTVILPRNGAFPAPFATVSTNVSAIPIMVYAGAGTGGSDIIQVMTASAGLSEAPMEVRLNSVGANSLQLNNTLGIRGGDLMLLTEPAPRPCMVVQAAAGYVGGAAPSVDFGGPYFSGAIGPNIVSYGTSGVTTNLVNLGNQSGNTPRFQLLGINAAQQLVGYDLLRLNNMPGNADQPVPLAEGVMNLRVRYGISSTMNGIVDSWAVPETGTYTVANMNASTAAAATAMQQIVAVRVAMLMRGDRIEDNTQVSPSSFTLFSSLPAGMQVTLPVSADEQKRNYKVVEFTVPIRNAVVASPSRTPPP